VSTTETGRRILVIDDDVVDRELIRRLISSDHQLLEAATASAAMQLLQQQKPVCALLDFRLPDVQGLELLDRLVARHLPVIMLTRQGNEAIAVEAMKRGAKDYLIKSQMDADGLRSSIQFAIDQQHAETRLREGEANVRAIFEAALDCIIAIDDEANIVDFNVAAERTFGYRRHEVIGRPMYDALFTPDVSERVRRNIAAYLSTSEDGSMLGKRQELQAVRKDGSTFIAEIAMQPIPLRGEAVLAVFLQDITKRKQAETQLTQMQDELRQRVAERTAELRTAYEQLQQKMSERQRSEQEARQHREELAHATRLNTMGEMASGMAHELNQPLTAIVAHVESCLDTLLAQGQQDEDVLDDLRRSVEQARRAGQIIKRLRAMVGKRESERTTFDIRDAIQQVVMLAETETKQMDVNIVLEHDVVVPLIRADRIQIEQVLLNLVRNALESMRDVKSSERKLRISTSADEQGGLVVDIIDRGRGASPEELARLFDPFYTTRQDGLGLGLSISRTIINVHGGRLTATGNPDRGLTFQFTLPAQP
jgi:two-component system sensor kinase FixL